MMNDATSFSILTKGATNTREWSLVTSGTDFLVFQVSNGTSANTITATSTTALTAYQGKWIHVVATYDGSEAAPASSVSLYVNGSPLGITDDSTGTYTGMSNQSDGATIGRNRTDGTLYSRGYIGRIVLYNKELSYAEVKEESTLDDLNFFSAKSNIVSWWEPEDFDGTTLKDRKGGNHATAANIDSTNRVNGTMYPRRWQSRADGENINARYGGYGWTFDGVNEDINIGDASSLDFGTNDFSISAWIKCTNNALSKSIFTKISGVTASDTGYGIFILSTGELFGRICDGTTTVGSTIDGYSLEDQCWHHVVVTFDRDGNMVRYVDGASYGSATSISTVSGSVSNTLNALIGNRDVSSSYYVGSIADVIVYNKVLSSTEVSQIYNNGQPRDETKTNISNKVSYWRAYNSSTGSGNVIDQVGSNHGTMNNMEGTDTQYADRNYPVKILSDKGSVDFDGSNEYIVVPSSSSLEFTSGGNDLPFSISAWCRMDTATSFSILSKRIVYQFITDTGNNLSFVVATDATNFVGRRTGTVTSYVGFWTMFTATYDGSETNGGIKLYINTLRSDTTNTGTGSHTGMPSSSTDISIGALDTAGLRPANGRISRPSVWNKALSQIEVEELYNNGTPPDLTKLSFASNLVSAWKLGGSDSLTTSGGVVDLNTTNANNGTAQNMEAGDLSTTIYPT